MVLLSFVGVMAIECLVSPEHHHSVPAEGVPLLAKEETSPGDVEVQSCSSGSLTKSGGGRASASAVLMLLSVAVHAVFEGVAVGTADTAAASWLITAILCAHKWVEGLVLSATLRLEGVSFRAAMPMLTIFIIGTPLGSILGLLVRVSAEGGAASACCVAVASGTILFVCCSQVIPAEFGSEKRDLRAKTALLGVGAAFVAAVASLMPFAESLSGV
eukprot:Polyplicarium_translucidae@DN3019_c0_g1_i4.p1